MPEPLKILVFHRNAPLYEPRLKEALPEAEIVATTDPAVLREHIATADILISIELSAEVAAQARRLRWVQATSAGVEGLLPARAQLAGVAVTNARGIHSDLMSDYVMAAMVMLLWDFPALMREQAARRWNRRPKRPLSGLTAGVVGLGPIGRAIAERAVSSGMDVIGVRNGAGPVAGIRTVYPAARLAEVLPRCDFVVLAVPTTDETRRMIGGDELAAMKPGAFLINVARGAVVDEPALVAALRNRTIAGAALDVFETEPLPASSPLWDMPNVIVTPHVAGMSETNEDRFVALFLDNLQRYRQGEPLRNIIDLERGY